MRLAILGVLTTTLIVTAPACAQAPPPPDADSAAVARWLAGGESWATDFSRTTVPVREIISGGPPRDGIPSIDAPRFESVAAADEWLELPEPVVVLEIGDAVRAYPLRILIRHEIVNDEVGGTPVSVTYCPLCNTSLVFDRRFDGRVLDFGTTGRLRHSDLVMYDRQTETWWQQASGEGLVGEYAGARLDFIPANTLSWKMAKELHPDLEVLSRDTGFRMAYGANPYVGYDRAAGPYGRFFQLEVDDRFPALERIAAVDLASGWAAPFSELRRTGVAEAEVAGQPLVVFWVSGVASPVDDRNVAEGRDVGASAVYDRRVGGRTLDFERVGASFRDRQTESTWDFAGRAISGPLAGERLEPIPHGNHFWFAWAAFRPETEIWAAGPSRRPPSPRIRTP